MKTLSLIFDKSDITLSKDLQDKTSQELVYMLIRNIILIYANTKQGLSEEERRLYYKICDAFEEALKLNAEKVELDDNWFGFIRKCKRESLLMPDKLLQKVEVLIEDIKYD